ncbi:MAG: NADH:ubiquinone reductase (Na(+)-transporting) subunit A [Bacteroidetes bacterium GWA2_30_7]|nr:MAG: NADH:ubiquinone reductase (Na(+)-transporting) subunit A [Bacteroidetes bacterium GWA2_30_7]
MAKSITLNKGLNIRLDGEAEKIFIKTEISDKYAVKPTDFIGLTPKLLVKEGDEVKAGSPLFIDKYNPEINFVSPVSGKVSEIKRGERRRILEVIIDASKEIVYNNFEKIDIEKASAQEIKTQLLKAGLWTFIIQRPYGIIANPAHTPKSIFISAFDTAPLAPDVDFVMQDDEEFLQKGINALKKLTNGVINLNVNGNYNVSKVFTHLKNVELNKIEGIHPAGNVGIQIHHIDPINKGEVVWVINPQDVVAIGRFFEKRIFDAHRIIALTGSEVIHRKYYKTIIGSSVKTILKDNVSGNNFRVISGNVLTGKKIDFEGFIGFYDTQVTVIPEGNHFEFLGWGMPGLNKFSASKTFFSWMMPSKKYKLDTNINGGHRAFVMTNQYEKVVPMDIYPQYLLKAILAEDIDKMEQLGIYEVIEEDLALCEFVCTSKIDVQEILRKGLDLVRKEMS